MQYCCISVVIAVAVGAAELGCGTPEQSPEVVD